MAKFKPKKDADESLAKGMARRTFGKARFFLEQADRSERHIEAYECYVEASVIFARSALGHLRREFGRKRGFPDWMAMRERNPLIKSLIDTRDELVHESAPSIIPSQNEDTFYYDQASPEIRTLHETLPNQLDEIVSIIDECERKFK